MNDQRIVVATTLILILIHLDLNNISIPIVGHKKYLNRYKENTIEFKYILEEIILLNLTVVLKLWGIGLVSLLRISFTVKILNSLYKLSSRKLRILFKIIL